MLLISQDLWEIFEKGYNGAASLEEKATSTKVTKKENEDNKIKDTKALAFLYQRVSKSIRPRISNATTSAKAWKILQKQFGGYKR